MQPFPTLQSVRFWRILVATWVAYGFYSMLRRPLSVVRATMIADHDMSMNESGAVDTAFLIMYTVGQLWYPSIRARIPGPSRYILAAGLGLSAICVVLFGMLPSASSAAPAASSSTQGGSGNSSGGGFGATAVLAVRCLLWGMLGLTQAVGWASCLVVLTPWLEPRERGAVMGAWGTNMALGGAVGNTVASAVLSATGGSWATVFVVCGGMAVAVAVALLFWLGPHPNALNLRTAAQQQKAHELPETAFDAMMTGASDIEGEWILDGSDAPQAVKSSAASKSNITGGTFVTDNSGNSPVAAAAAVAERHVVFLPGIFGIASSYFFHKLVRYVLMFWLPFYLSTVLKLDPATAGMTATALDFGGIAGTIGSGLLSDRIGAGRRKALTVTLLSAGVLLSLLGFAAGLAAAGTAPTLLLCFLAGACTFGVDSLLTGSLLQDHCEKIGAPHRIGAVGAFVGGVGTLGSMLQGPFTVAMSAVSWGWLFASMAGMTAVAMAALWPVVRAERSAPVPADKNEY